MNYRLKFMLSASLLLAVAALIADAYRTNAQLKSAASGSDRRSRMIEDQSHSDTPVKIVEVRNEKRRVNFKESFDEDDDWLKGLMITVENQSKVAVNHVGIDLLLERPREQMGELPAFWNMTYGSNPFWLKPQEHYHRIRPIQPGETQEIRLSNEAYKEMRSFLKKVGYSAGGEKVRVAISTIGFTNGTAWRGRLYYRDPGASDGWTTEEKPQGSARNRTAFFHELVQTSNGSFRRVQWKKIGTSRFSRPPQGALCGRATPALSYCVSPDIECKYEHAGIFNPDDPLKRDTPTVQPNIYRGLPPLQMTLGLRSTEMATVRLTMELSCLEISLLNPCHQPAKGKMAFSPLLNMIRQRMAAMVTVR